MSSEDEVAALDRIKTRIALTKVEELEAVGSRKAVQRQPKVKAELMTYIWLLHSVLLCGA